MRSEGGAACKNGGNLFPLGDTTKLRPLPKPKKPITIDAAAIMHVFAAGPSLNLQGLATVLGVALDALKALGVVWAAPEGAWAFPMKNSAGVITGIRLRSNTGFKWAVTGSIAGMFYAEGSAPIVYVVEGASDCAAAMTIGLAAIGRHACLGGEREIDRLLRHKGARRAVIVADGDDPGQRGAEKLQEALSMPSVIFYPPADDLRTAVQAGLTADLIDSLIGSLIWTQPKRQ